MLSIRHLFRSAATARKGKRPRFRPVIEFLEERAVPADLMEWTGAVSNAWENAGNWSPEWVPDANKIVYVTLPQNERECWVNNNGIAQFVSVQNGATLVVNSTLEVMEGLGNSNSTLIVNAGKTLKTNGLWSILNEGWFFLHGKADAVGSAVDNSGAMITGLHPLVKGNLWNHGGLWVGDAAVWENNYATGDLTINGGFVQTAGDQTVLSVSGRTDYDVVHVDNLATFAGHLDVEPVGNIVARPNWIFKIFYYGARDGTFDETSWVIGGLTFNARYLANRLELYVPKVGQQPGVNVGSSLNPSQYGQSVTFTATVSGLQGTPTGEVVFLSDGEEIGSATLNAQGVATFTTSSLAVGIHSVTALYLGDGTYAWEESSALSQTVNKAATTTDIVSSDLMANVGQPITFTATVDAPMVPGLIPQGTVEFWDMSAPGGPVLLGTGTLDANGEATYTTSSLSQGLHQIKAIYLGDDCFASSFDTLWQTIMP